MSKTEIAVLFTFVGMLLAFGLVLSFEFYCSQGENPGSLYGLISALL